MVAQWYVIGSQYHRAQNTTLHQQHAQRGLFGETGWREESAGGGVR